MRNFRGGGFKTPEISGIPNSQRQGSAFSLHGLIFEDQGSGSRDVREYWHSTSYVHGKEQSTGAMKNPAVRRMRKSVALPPCVRPMPAPPHIASSVILPVNVIHGEPSFTQTELEFLRRCATDHTPIMEQRQRLYSPRDHLSHYTGGGVRIHPENARMIGRHGVHFVAQCVACAALTLVVWQ